MAATVGDFLLTRLAAWGVRRIFGYPGDGINGIMGALGRTKENIEFVQTRHEEMAAFMATAHAKFSGGVGVCLATSGPEQIEKNVDRWWRLLEARAMNEAHPINPQRVFWELSPRLPDDCILTCDSGSAANWYARDLKMRHDGIAVRRPCHHGTGRAVCNRRQVRASASSCDRDWGDPRLTVMVFNNSDLNQVTWEQRAMEGDPKFLASQVLPKFPYAAYADMLGLGGIRVDKPQDIGPAWHRALSASVPTVLEVVTDPDVPPLPPHISAKQAKAYLSALWQRDPDSLGIIQSSIKEVWDGLFPPSAKGS